MPPFILHARIGSWPLVRRWRVLPVACEVEPRLAIQAGSWATGMSQRRDALPVDDFGETAHLSQQASGELQLRKWPLLVT
jgi:hypothetical protein